MSDQSRRKLLKSIAANVVDYDDVDKLLPYSVKEGVC